MSKHYREYPRETDCELTIKISPDMLEDLCLHAEAIDMNLDELILQIIAGRLGRSQQMIKEQRLENAMKELDALDNLHLIGLSRNRLQKLAKGSRDLQEHVKQCQQRLLCEH